MEFWLFAIIVLLVVILYMQSERFAKINSEINAVKKRLDLLLEKKKESSPAEDTNRTPSLVKPVAVPAKSASAPAESIPAPVPKEKEKADNPSVVIPEALLSMWEETSSDTKPEAEEPMPEMAAVMPEPLVADVAVSPSVSEQPESPKRTSAEFTVKRKKNMNYEKFIGENLFGKIGILVLVVGIGLFVKYAIDKDWINETMRTVLGFVAGSILLFIAERVREKYRTFSSLLAGGAFAVFYLTVAIAYHYYHLFSQTAAFVILVCITVLMSVLALLYDRRELAIISLIGGFVAPFLVSSGEGNYIVLFTYLTILNLGMFGLSLYKKWAELPAISFVATYLVFAIYVVTGFAFGAAPAESATIMARNLLAFSTLFYFIFLLPVLAILKNDGKKLNRFLLSVIVANNFIYLAFGTLFLNGMSLPFKATGLFTLFIAVVNLVLVVWLRKSKQDYNFLIYTMLGLVLTFVSLTVPIQLEGNYITLFWASEMVLLLWLYVKSGIRVYETFSVILAGLTLVSYLMDVEHQITGLRPAGTIFMNSLFATGLFTGLAAGGYAFLIAKYRDSFDAARYLKYTPWNATMLIAAVVILYYTFMIEFYHYLSPAISYKMMHLFTSGCILTLCYGFKRRFPVQEFGFYYCLGIGVNVILYAVCVWAELTDPAGFEPTGLLPLLLPWLTTVVVIADLVYVGRLYSRSHVADTRFVVYLSVLSTICWLAVVRLFLRQLGLPDEFNAGFSIALAMAGFVQMSVGMRLHRKSLRMVSLVTLGLVLVKLVLIDLWAMPTVGKILIFILLGVILLVLSFLYQKLKNVLFKDDHE